MPRPMLVPAMVPTPFVPWAQAPKEDSQPAMQRPDHEQLGSVGEGVLDRVAVEVLIDAIPSVVPAARGLGLHWPARP